MTVTKKPAYVLFLVFSLLVVSGVIVTTLPDESVFGASSVSTCYLLLLSVVFYYMIGWVTVNGTIRNNLLCCSVLFIVIFLVRGSRYIAFSEMNQVLRYLWYFYYGPLLLIPFFSFRAACCVGKPDDWKCPQWHLILGAVSAVLMVLVFTNDSHQMVFCLNPGFREHWVDEYSYGPLYYVVYVWIAGLLVASLLLLFKKCRIATCRSQIWIPLLPSVIGFLLLTMIALGIIPSINGHLMIEFPEAFFFTVAATWGCCIRIGLLPANKAYAELFGISSIHAKICDHMDHVIYRSREITEQADPDTIRTQKKEIHGGHVFWQTDVSEILRINRELDDIHEQLEEETELIRLENELKARNAALETKNAVYDAIAVRVLPQSEKISELSSAVPADPEEEKRSLQMICLYGCYIKRMSNLMLIAAQQPVIGEMEFALAVGESINHIRRLGVHTSVFAEESDRSFDAAGILSAYETFEQYIEQMLQGLAGVQVTISQGVCKLTLECREMRPIVRLGISEVEYDDDIFFITIPFAEGGDSVMTLMNILPVYRSLLCFGTFLLFLLCIVDAVLSFQQKNRRMLLTSVLMLLCTYAVHQVLKSVIFFQAFGRQAHMAAICGSLPVWCCLTAILFLLGVGAYILRW